MEKKGNELSFPPFLCFLISFYAGDAPYLRYFFLWINANFSGFLACFFHALVYFGPYFLEFGYASGGTFPAEEGGKANYRLSPLSDPAFRPAFLSGGRENTEGLPRLGQNAQLRSILLFGIFSKVLWFFFSKNL